MKAFELICDRQELVPGFVRQITDLLDRVTLDTEEAKASLRFTEVEMDRGSAIIIDSVAPGSVAEQVLQII